MKVAYATTFDAQDVNNWSGTPYFMSNALRANDISIEYIGDLKRKLPSGFKLKQVWNKYVCNQRESPRFNITAAQHYSQQVDEHLKKMEADIIIAPQINPIAYVNSSQPIVLWTDALYASLIGFYSGFGNHSANSIKQGNIITRECLGRTKLAIFSSDWAANSAIELYGVDKEKVKVVPFGANLKSYPNENDIKDIIKKRNPNIVKLLFLGKHWDRKGGDTVFNVAKALHASGQSVELNFVGCYPPKHITIPDYIKCHGFISKRTAEGMKKIQKLLYDSHFLFVPSRAEAFGIVFCEANAYALPCLTSYIGGIATVVKNNINGMTFSLDAPVEKYCEYISHLMQHYSEYETLALSAYNEFKTRLNWEVTSASVRKLITEIM